MEVEVGERGTAWVGISLVGKALVAAIGGVPVADGTIGALFCVELHPKTNTAVATTPAILSKSSVRIEG